MVMLLLGRMVRHFSPESRRWTYTRRGLWSTTREKILGRPCRPTETGDLAYRATFEGSQLRQLQDPVLNALLDAKATHSWWGPDKHCVLYPVRGGTSYNLVLLRPDNLPPGVSKSTGDLQEMRDIFEDWDPMYGHRERNP